MLTQSLNVVLVLCIVACGSRHTTQKFNLDPKASSADKLAFSEAIDYANASMGCKMFVLDETAEINIHFTGSDKACNDQIDSADSEQGFTDWSVYPQVCVKSVSNLSTDIHAVRDLYMHEMGHAAGLNHILDKTLTNVMYPYIGDDDDIASMGRFLQQLKSVGNVCLD